MTGFRLLHDSNAKEVSAYLIESFARELETQIRNGNIHAFSDKEVKDSLSMEEALTNFRKPVAMQVINPNNPDDPYDLIDTVIITPAAPEMMDGIFLGDQLDSNYTVRLQAISVYCDEAEGFFKNYYYYSDHPSGIIKNWYWIMWQDLSNQLNNDERNLLLFLNAWTYLNPSP